VALWDSSDLVRRAKLRIARPTTDEAFTVTTTDDVWFDFATESQDRINTLLGIFVPDSVWTVPTELSTSDSGRTYTFGTDVDSAAIFAFGHYKLFENQESIPDYPLVEGVDYTIEGTKIRIPNNVTRTFTDGGPYAQFASPSNVITSSTQPTIPKFARKPMISDMVRQGLDRLGLDSTTAEADFQREWLDVLTAIRTQGFGKGGRTTMQRPRSFWRMRRW
jgi:hypothetical protein